MKLVKLPKNQVTIRFGAKLFRPKETEKIGSWALLTLPKNASAKLSSRSTMMVEGTINSSLFSCHKFATPEVLDAIHGGSGTHTHDACSRLGNDAHRVGNHAERRGQPASRCCTRPEGGIQPQVVTDSKGVATPGCM